MFDVTVFVCVSVLSGKLVGEKTYYCEDGHYLSKQTSNGLNVGILKTLHMLAGVMFCTQIDMINL